MIIIVASGQFIQKCARSVVDIIIAFNHYIYPIKMKEEKRPIYPFGFRVIANPNHCRAISLV